MNMFRTCVMVCDRMYEVDRVEVECVSELSGVEWSGVGSSRA